MRIFSLLAPFFAAVCAYGSITATPVVSPASPQPVGTIVTISFSATDSGPGPLNYRLEVAPPGGDFQLVHDYNTMSSFAWAQNLNEGSYQLRVTARDNSTGEVSQAVIPYTITSRVSGTQSVVTATAHPLVALFSAPACAAGSTMRVGFKVHGTTNLSYTNAKNCTGGSMNFLVAGLYPNTTYDMNWVVTTNGSSTSGPANLQFTSGSIPGSFESAGVSVPVPSGAGTSSKDKIILSGFALAALPYAVNLNGSVVWFYNGPATFVELQRLLPGGDMMVCTGLPNAFTGTGIWGNQTKYQMLQEIDLAGNVVRETNVDRINEQIPAGKTPITSFNHDSIRLPNGHTLAIASTQALFPPGTQGNANQIGIVGDAVLDLDQNLQLAWFWDAFAHDGGNGQLDLARPATLGETCAYQQQSQNTPLGCPPVLLTNPENDWLHANSLQYEPDGSVIVSLRNQDWVIDIDYANGQGSGNILWRLGPEGDFGMQTSGQYPWFSHQHDAEFKVGGMTALTIFDNGNTRIAEFGGNSRGMVFHVNTSARQASVLYSFDLGVNAPAVGSAQTLSNGNFFFLAGEDPFSNPPLITSWNNEYSPSGTLTYRMKAMSTTYRSFRIPDMYTPPNGAGVNAPK